MIDENRLIEWIKSRETKAPDPLSFKWYTKRGYADWIAALAVQKERKAIIKYILEELKNGMEDNTAVQHTY